MKVDDLFDAAEAAMKRRVAHIWGMKDDLIMERFHRDFPDVSNTMRVRIGLEVKRTDATNSD